MIVKQIVTLRRACNVEVPRKDRQGRPSYAWVQGWTYTTPSGGEAQALRLRHARQDYPGAAIKLED